MRQKARPAHLVMQQHRKIEEPGLAVLADGLVRALIVGGSGVIGTVVDIGDLVISQAGEEDVGGERNGPEIAASIASPPPRRNDLEVVL